MDLQKVLADADKALADCEASPDWAGQDNPLAKVEAIRLRAWRDIVALGFEAEEIQVGVDIFPQEMELFHLAGSLGWKAVHSWFEPPCKVDGGEITVYYEVETPDR